MDIGVMYFYIMQRKIEYLDDANDIYQNKAQILGV